MLESGCSQHRGTKVSQILCGALGDVAKTFWVLSLINYFFFLNSGPRGLEDRRRKKKIPESPVEGRRSKTKKKNLARTRPLDLLSSCRFQKLQFFERILIQITQTAESRNMPRHLEQSVLEGFGNISGGFGRDLVTFFHRNSFLAAVGEYSVRKRGCSSGPPEPRRRSKTKKTKSPRAPSKNEGRRQGKKKSPGAPSKSEGKKKQLIKESSLEPVRIWLHILIIVLIRDAETFFNGFWLFEEDVGTALL